MATDAGTSSFDDIYAEYDQAFRDYQASDFASQRSLAKLRHLQGELRSIDCKRQCSIPSQNGYTSKRM
jgi:hypothetical protein